MMTAFLELQTICYHFWLIDLSTHIAISWLIIHIKLPPLSYDMLLLLQLYFHITGDQFMHKILSSTEDCAK